MKKYGCASKLLLIALILSLFTGTVFAANENGQSDVYALSEEAAQLAINPAMQDVVAALNQIDSITAVQSSCTQQDGQLYSLTFPAGRIDVFETEEEALTFDGTLLEKAAPGAHCVMGSMVIQIIDSSAPETLMDEIAQSLTGETRVVDEDTSEQNADEDMVWIPTNGGKRYHIRGSCSNMINPRLVTVEEAQNLGFTPCKKCY